MSLLGSTRIAGFAIFAGACHGCMLSFTCRGARQHFSAGGGEGLLTGFLELVLRCLLLDSSMAGSLTGLAADALLPLILGHPNAYQLIGKGAFV